MRCNWWRWLWGIIPLLILGWIAVEAEHSRLEQDLSSRAAAALNGAGLSWAATGFQGRDGVLTGRASDVSDPDKAMSLLSNVWGVRVVDNRADLIEQVENYVWFASRRNNRVRLTGYVPQANARQVILGVARASFPGFEIQDRMKLARGVPSVDAWLGGVSFALKQLTSLKRGDARLDALSLYISGEAEDVNGYRSVRSALVKSLPKGLKLSGSSIQPPAVSPHVWTARFDGATMAFKGNVPTDTDQAAILAAAREKLAEKSVTDDSEPGDGTPQGWADAALLAVRQLRRLENGTAEIKDGVLTLSGLAGDDATAEAVRNAFKGLPPTIKFVDAMQLKPPPKPAEAPPVAPPPTPEANRSAQPQQPPSTPAAAPPPAATPSPPVAAPRPAMVEPKPEPKVEAAPKPPAVVVPAPAPPAAAAPAASPSQLRAAKACQETLSGLAAAGAILFRYASAELSQSSSETLDKLAAAAKECPDMTILIGGYASAEGSVTSNLRLSLNRARSVLDYLVKAGVDVRQLEAKGYGIERPAAPNTSLENMAKNRRIEFTVRPAGSEQRSGK